MECHEKRTGMKRALKVLHDSAKARREVELHWRASGCIHIVEVSDGSKVSPSVRRFYDLPPRLVCSWVLVRGRLSVIEIDQGPYSTGWAYG